MKNFFKSKRFDYKWVIAAVSFLMVLVTMGFCSSNKSVYIGAITEANGISRSMFSFNDSFRFLSTAIVNIFFGTLIEKFGAKKLVLAGFVALIFSALCNSVASNIAVFYLGGIFLGIGLSFTTTAMVSCMVNKWFKENKGTIMGAILAANGLGGALAAQIVYPIIYEENNMFGYQNAYRLVALILFVTAIIVFVFLKEQPESQEKTAFKVAKKKPKGESWIGLEYSKVKKLKIYHLTLICVFITGFMLTAINGVAAAHLRDVDLNANYIALILSLHSIALTVFKFLTGFLYDKLGLRITTAVCCVASIITMFSLVLSSNTTSGKVYAMIWGIISSLALPLETVMIPLFVSDLFGEKAFNKILGILMTVNTFGFALGSPVINVAYDLLGSYKSAFFACGILMILVTLIMQYVITKAHKIRKDFLKTVG
ncbi:MAG: MFS transporter [Ruminococcaceae bacterium]|nr:MFS transporter [Oscillospiraceae bacterium]